MTVVILLMLSLAGSFPACSVGTFLCQKKTQVVVIDTGGFSENYAAPLRELSKGVQSHPNSRLFRVTGTLMFGGWQNYRFWYDRQSQRLRYSYASGGETYAGEKESVWSGVTTADLEALAKQTQDVSSESFFKTLPQLGCHQVYFHTHPPDGRCESDGRKPQVSARPRRLPRYTLVDLGQGQAAAISSDGQVTGSDYAGDQGQTAPDAEHPWIWQRGVRRSITPAHLKAVGPAYGLAYKGLYQIAYIMSGRTRRFLTVPSGTMHSEIHAVTKAGLATGNCYFGFGNHAVLWNLHRPDVQPRILQPPGTSTSWSADINQAGEVVGSAKVINRPGEFGFLWRKGRFTSLGRVFPGTGYETYATRINDREQVIGYEIGRGQHPFLWERGHIYDLEHLLINNSGWVLAEMNGLNNKGQIVGWGHHYGTPRAVLLSPSE